MEGPDNSASEAAVFVQAFNTPSRGEWVSADMLDRRLRALRFDVARLQAENINLRGEVDGLRARSDHLQAALELITAERDALDARLRMIPSIRIWRLLRRLVRRARGNTR
jgi:hypothetical protein